MDVRQMTREIKQGQIAPVYVFYGREQYLMDECIRLIEEQVIEEASRDFNYSTFDLRETPIQIALQDAETFPFMGDKRLVRAHRALFLTGTKTRETVEHDLEALLAYVTNPPDYTVLILEVPEEKLDERKKVVKALKTNAALVAFEPLKDMALLEWVADRAKKYGVSIEAQAAQELVTMAGSDLRQLSQEIEKMGLYAGREGVITADIVNLLGSRQIEQDVFRLIDKVAHLKLEEAMRLFYDLQLNKEEPLKILSLLARQFRILLQVKTLQPKGYSPQQIAQTIGIHPYAAKLASQQAGAFSERSLRRILQRMAEEDYRIKTGQIDKTLSLELLIMGMKDSITAS
ncbi:DNA polymerase III subunit delta [Aneurinibacillus sp. Ricciae_BoGa-3]|uniref:DNA polymerase III subunit delta n=1 Tax=Aneurinibacillus sp. Ricciae_BoGa-3 TaxID=3022697 RepID=UPI002341C9F9|nr:DNA polymerase III subunit delta [Aneurinibacillus sp. Ricciae_BoGa-3]WCK53503.1 DNA polymerase III subunit delta [Aneurinibacillus sp. Ricciae_BoGa-3]